MDLGAIFVTRELAKICRHPRCSDSIVGIKAGYCGKRLFSPLRFDACIVGECPDQKAIFEDARAGPGTKTKCRKHNKADADAAAAAAAAEEPTPPTEGNPRAAANKKPPAKPPAAAAAETIPLQTPSSGGGQSGDSDTTAGLLQMVALENQRQQERLIEVLQRQAEDNTRREKRQEEEAKERELMHAADKRYIIGAVTKVYNMLLSSSFGQRRGGYHQFMPAPPTRHALPPSYIPTEFDDDDSDE
ncbi:hypothetical protein B0H63DRAFT_446852 [Podospora didyma]|uniref:Uncharacterized protein n=1 Tax=Podospora didyma TaxID=330526 RepID=A0AAE0P013_9PEZI|nr:hypothetical protein B0H63DRAFT_446852 [Podospora didyma]